MPKKGTPEYDIWIAKFKKQKPLDAPTLPSPDSPRDANLLLHLKNAVFMKQLNKSTASFYTNKSEFNNLFKGNGKTMSKDKLKELLDSLGISEALKTYYISQYSSEMLSDILYPIVLSKVKKLTPFDMKDDKSLAKSILIPKEKRTLQDSFNIFRARFKTKK